MQNEEKLAHLSGQIAVLGIALQALLKRHPHKSEIAEAIHDEYERIVSKASFSMLPDAFLKGMKDALYLYLLSNPEDWHK